MCHVFLRGSRRFTGARSPSKEEIVLRFVYALTLVCLLLPPAESLAQTRGRRTAQRRPAAGSRARRPAGTTSPTALNEARIRVADEVKTLSRFLYLYGRTSVGVESNEQQARAGGGELSPQAAQIVNRSRTTLQQSVGDIRGRLDKLALYFRTTPGLEGFAPRITEAARNAADAEQRASAGQLDAAGRALVEVAARLADVLLEM